MKRRLLGIDYYLPEKPEDSTGIDFKPPIFLFSSALEISHIFLFSSALEISLDVTHLFLIDI